MHPIPIIKSFKDGTLELRINRPEARNCLNSEALDQLIHAFQVLPQESTVRSVVLTGTGDAAFCTGADIEDLVKHPTHEGREQFFGKIAQLIELVLQAPLPVIARVQGYALAGGCGLAAACDLVVASDDSKFGLPEVAVGLAPMVVMAPLSRCLSARALARLAITGEQIDATEAFRIGLVSQVVSKHTLDAEVHKICESIARGASGAIKASKAEILNVCSPNLHHTLSSLATKSAHVSMSSEAHDRLTAFLTKRKRPQP